MSVGHLPLEVVEGTGEDAAAAMAVDAAGEEADARRAFT